MRVRFPHTNHQTLSLGTPGVLRTATIFFYLSNEGISILENAALLGLPIPGGLKQALDTIKQTGQNQPAFKTSSTPPAQASSPDKHSPPIPHADQTSPGKYLPQHALPDEIEKP